MSLTVTVTNLTGSALPLNDMYMSLGAAGTSTESITFTRSAAQLDAMEALKALWHAGSVSVGITRSVDDVDVISVALEQHGVISSVSVNEQAVVATPVVFSKAFSSGVVPTVRATIVQSSTTAFQAGLYLRSVVNTGFTAALDVVTEDDGEVTGENPDFTPAEDGNELGPFTATLADVPLTSEVITLHWEQSAVAKSATITGTSTLGGADAGNLVAASINRTTGALSITFDTGNAPDSNSITVDYAQLKTCNIHWVAKY